MRRSGVIMLAALAFFSTSNAFAKPAKDGEPCKLAAADGVFGSQTGVIVNGVCQPVTGDAGTGHPHLEYRRVACTDTGAALLDGQVVGRCGPNGIPPRS